MTQALEATPMPTSNVIDLRLCEPATHRAELEPRMVQALDTIRSITRCVGVEIQAESVQNVSQVPKSPRIFVLNGDTKNAKAQSKLQGASFAFAPERLSGTADSAHAVLSGEIGLDYNGRSDPKHVDVAIKCFRKRRAEDRIERAIREASFLEELRGKGEPTLRPIAIAIAPDDGRTHGEAALITEYDPSISTLDNRPWGRGLTEQNVDTAQKAAATIGRFNSQHAIQHGDAKVKNVAVNGVDGACTLIDFETSKKIDTDDPQEAAIAASQDLGLFFDSLRKKGLFAKNNDVRAVQKFIADVADSYLTAWETGTPEVQEKVLESVSHICLQNSLDILRA